MEVLKYPTIIQLLGVVYFFVALLIYLAIVGRFDLGFGRYILIGLLIWPLPAFWKHAQRQKEQGVVESKTIRIVGTVIMFLVVVGGVVVFILSI